MKFLILYFTEIRAKSNISTSTITIKANHHNIYKRKQKKELQEIGYSTKIYRKQGNE